MSMDCLECGFFGSLADWDRFVKEIPRDRIIECFGFNGKISSIVIVNENQKEKWKYIRPTESNARGMRFQKVLISSKYKNSIISDTILCHIARDGKVDFF